VANKSDPCSPIVRFMDLQKQGFMRPVKVRKKKEQKPSIACDDCLNWHTKGRHTANRETRKVNRLARIQSASTRRQNSNRAGS
jgi:hypothetical protein